MYYENYDLDNVVTPVDIISLKGLLNESRYDERKTHELIDGFEHGFRLGFTGDRKVKRTAPNLRFNGVGDKIVLWNKVMKEVKAKRYAGPFKQVPFEYYIQSPIGLVPKDGNDTRLIFHLSYPKGKGTSVNANTDKKLCSVHYPDFNDAVKLCLKTGVNCHTARSDMRSAFRQLGLSPLDWCLLVMKAQCPITGIWWFFVDKAVPFGSARSCALFQEFSNAIAHIIRYRTKHDLVNYLDDYLFVALLKLICNGQVEEFLKVCKMINFPVAMEKTFWGTTCIVFLGFLINTESQTVSVPVEKVKKALDAICEILQNKSKKVTVKRLQQVCGFLNFIGRAIIPGRAFTRRLYAYYSNPQLKSHHHVRVSGEMRSDLTLWKSFLNHQSVFCRSFMDFGKLWHADEIDMYSDASKSAIRGFGATCNSEWLYSPWNGEFIRKYDPSIQYLELFAVTAGVLKWGHLFANKRIVLFCDNKSSRDMINATSSKCRNCMVLIRLIVLKSMIHNVRIFAKYVSSKDNYFADYLSRLQIRRFKHKAKGKFNKEPVEIPTEIWPMEKIWLKD